MATRRSPGGQLDDDAFDVAVDRIFTARRPLTSDLPVVLVYKCMTVCCHTMWLFMSSYLIWLPPPPTQRPSRRICRLPPPPTQRVGRLLLKDPADVKHTDKRIDPWISAKSHPGICGQTPAANVTPRTVWQNHTPGISAKRPSGFMEKSHHWDNDESPHPWIVGEIHLGILATSHPWIFDQIAPRIPGEFC